MKKILSLLILFFFILLTNPATQAYDNLSGGGASTFISLTDVFQSYAGLANLCVKVNSGESGLIAGACTSASVAAYDTVQNGGSSLTQRAVLNFTGAGVVCADATTKTTCTIPLGTARLISTTEPIEGGGDLSADRTLSCRVATGSVSGCLSAADFTTFNAKQGALSFTAPIVNNSGTVAMAAATSSVPGYLTAANWTTFNGKENVITFSAPLTRATNTVSIAAATTAVPGYLTAADWNTFNGKENVITVNAPITRSVNALSIAKATGSVDGYLAATDWTIFNAKEPAVTFTDPIHRSSQTITCIAATGSVAGCLSAADWTTFNGKENALTFNGPLSRSTNAISIAKATAAVDGYLAATDFVTFNAKESALTFTDPIHRATNTITCIASDATHNGCLSSTDWSNFNAKLSSFSASTPLVLGGGVLSIPPANGSTNGYLTSADWNTFNNKGGFTQNVAVESLAVTDPIDCNSYNINKVQHSTAGNGTITANPQIVAGTVNGQQCVLVGGHATQTITISDGTGVSLPGMTTHTFRNKEAMTFRWDSTLSVWVAQSTAYVEDVGAVSHKFLTSLVDGVATNAQPVMQDISDLPTFGNIVTHDSSEYLASSDVTVTKRGDFPWDAHSALSPGSVTAAELADTYLTGAADITFTGTENFSGANEASKILPVKAGTVSVCADGKAYIDSTDHTFHFCSDTTDEKFANTTAGAGTTVTAGVVATDSTKADFLASGALTCGAATQGKMKVHTTPLQYCDNAATPTLKYAAYGDSAGKATTLASGVVNQAIGIYIPASQMTTMCVSPTGTARYVAITGNATSNTQATAAIPFPYTGHITKMYVNGFAQALPASETFIVTVFPNDGAGTVTCSIAAGAASCNDTAHSDAITAGQNLTVKFQCNGATTAPFNNGGVHITLNVTQP